MSRSLKTRHLKNGTFISWCGGSNKKDKRIANRKFRRLSNMDAKLSILNDMDMFSVHDLKDVSNPWNFSTDGLAQYITFTNKCNEEIRKYRMK